MVEIPETCIDLPQNPELVLSAFEKSYKYSEILKSSLGQQREDFHFTETLKKNFPLEEIRFYLYLSMIVAPFAGFKVEVNPKTKKTEPLILHLIKGSFKVIQ